MKTRSVKKYLMAVCSLVTGLSTVPVLADWNINQSYKPENFYDNGKFGNFPPSDIDQKLLRQLDTVNQPEKGQFRPDSTLDSSGRNQPAPVATNQQASTSASDCAKQNLQQPAYNSYNRSRNAYPQNNQRYNRSTSFSGPWNNNGSNFSGPWNNNGSNMSMPWGNNESGFNPMGNGNGGGWSW
jgi:hypothetical protein